MPNITKRKNKAGEVISYRIRVSRGYDSEGNKLYSMKINGVDCVSSNIQNAFCNCFFRSACTFFRLDGPSSPQFQLQL